MSLREECASCDHAKETHHPRVTLRPPAHWEEHRHAKAVLVRGMCLANRCDCNLYEAPTFDED